MEVRSSCREWWCPPWQPTMHPRLRKPPGVPTEREHLPRGVFGQPIKCPRRLRPRRAKDLVNGFPCWKVYLSLSPMASDFGWQSALPSCRRDGIGVQGCREKHAGNSVNSQAMIPAIAAQTWFSCPKPRSIVDQQESLAATPHWRTNPHIPSSSSMPSTICPEGRVASIPTKDGKLSNSR